MTTLVSPGIQVREFNISTIIPSVTTSSGAIAGVFPWGPVGTPTLVDTENALVDTFGKPSNFNPETWFTGASFLAYTNSLWVNRAADTTGNTVIKSFSDGNTTNLVMESGNNQMQANNTNNISVGMKLFYSDASGLPVGATVTAVNSSIITLSDSASANVTNADSLVFREDVAYSAVALQSDLSLSAEDIDDWDDHAVLNSTDYEGRTAAFDTSILYVAKYPGELGNSLRVSVCDTPDQFKSNTNLAANAQINADATFLTGTVGSNTLTITVTPADTANSTNINAASTLITDVFNKLNITDLIEVGNNKIGVQYLKITGKVAVSNTDNVFSFTISTDDKVKLSTNTNNGYVTRLWEFNRSFNSAPGQSQYVRQFGNSSANDEVHVVIVDNLGKFSGSPGEVLESYQGLSRATDAKTEENLTNYYKHVINQQSKYIWFANDRTTAKSNTAEFVTSSSATEPLNMTMIGGSSGPDESEVPLGTLALAWDGFASEEDLPDISLLMQGKARGAVRTQLANYIIDNVALKRNPVQDCIAFISPDIDDVVNNKGEERADVVDFASTLRETSYGVLDSGYKYMYDKYNDVNRWIPLNGDIAGLCARTDLTNDAWWSPGGLTRGQIKNVIKLAWNPRQTDRDELYKNSVNPVISTPGLGTYLYGDKTLLSNPSAFDRINVRRLFIVLEKAIAKAAKYTLFEFNDDFTRSQFRNMVIPFLRDIQGKRGIQDFAVQCDASNNPPIVIDRNEFVGSIYVKPARSINFITLNFAAVGTDLSFNEIIGKVGF